tara:strand:+ start:198 stop:593 length:396 start_codon:yes stop_codon:yes gene_type:complete
MSQYSEQVPKNYDEWEVVLRTPRIFAKIEYGTFGKRPIDNWDLVNWWKDRLLGEGETVNTVPHPSLFFNNNRLSTQVPMRHIYYTDNRNMEKINGALNCLEFKYSEDWYSILSLQDMIKRLQKGEDPYLED